MKSHRDDERAGYNGTDAPSGNRNSPDYLMGQRQRARDDEKDKFNQREADKINRNNFIFNRDNKIIRSSNNKNSPLVIFVILILIPLGIIINWYDNYQKAKILAEKREHLYNKIFSLQEKANFKYIFGEKPKWFDFFNLNDKSLTVKGDMINKINPEKIDDSDASVICYFASYLKSSEILSKYVDKIKYSRADLSKKIENNISNNISECFANYEIDTKSIKYQSFPENFYEYLRKDDEINLVIDILYLEKRAKLFEAMKNIEKTPAGQFIFGKNDWFDKAANFGGIDKSKFRIYFDNINKNEITDQDAAVVCVATAIYIHKKQSYSRNLNLNQVSQKIVLNKYTNACANKLKISEYALKNVPYGLQTAYDY